MAKEKKKAVKERGKYDEKLKLNMSFSDFIKKAGENQKENIKKKKEG